MIRTKAALAAAVAMALGVGACGSTPEEDVAPPLEAVSIDPMQVATSKGYIEFKPYCMIDRSISEFGVRQDCVGGCEDGACELTYTRNGRSWTFEFDADKAIDVVPRQPLEFCAPACQRIGY